ncbi:uncharacterized protein LOC112564739 isoform X2 [Pomacea canaliculata]|uniref:uncharacterized protein LOC112564739 isoform X2 n=1 Tax=Pomacea canaliculata TaxID=400727 RepID=UPI000D72F84E|nr:uncharacterized protein LOC112564739 isoform X2 [Pomacea canaliculata]
MNVKNTISSRPSSDLPDDHCTFELNFAEADADFELQSNLFRTRPTSSPENSRPQENKDILNSHKKRKRDKDGFLTPTTPDIPKSSSKHGMPSHESLFGMGPKGDVASRRDANEGCWTSLDDGQQVLLSMTDSSKTPHDNAFTESAVNSSSMCAVGGDNTNSVQSYDSIFKDMIQEFKVVVMQSCQEFCGSEEHESQSLKELEKLLQEALDIEENLLRQKDFMHRRLAAISQRLGHPQEPNL